jgi:hypothetical protein
VRLLLDEHLSARHIGKRLEARGHDVATVSESPWNLGLDDDHILTLGADEGRIIVTCDAIDFALLTREWWELGRQHAGIVVVWSHLNHEFLGIADSVHRVLTANLDPDAWRGLVVGV